jgi:hypothetical protein
MKKRLVIHLNKKYYSAYNYCPCKSQRKFKVMQSTKGRGCVIFPNIFYVDKKFLKKKIASLLYALQ